MARLAMWFLGPPRLERDDEPLVVDTRKTIALLAYLAITGQSHSRDALATLLWPDSGPRQARAILRRNLSMLNKALGGEGLVVDRETIGLDFESGIWLDIEQFQHLAQSWQAHDHPPTELCSNCLTDLAQAAGLYRGDFLEGFSLRDSPNFDDWQSFETERLKREMAGLLEKLVEGHYARQEFEPAIGYVRHWLALDSLHEAAHRHLMRLYVGSGDRSAALRQYQQCVQTLKEELDAPPEAETTALYERIRQETEHHRSLIADVYALIDGDTPEGLEKNLLGRGGMGNVYRGSDIRSGEPVAIKVLKPEIVATSPDLVARFTREGEALRQLNHPNIVKMLATSHQAGQHYLVMEYVGGGSLHDLIQQEGPLSLQRLLEIALDLADALTRAHRLNIIHRDLKPANVLLTEDGTPRLTDFGIARMADSSPLTETGLLLGTVNYLSPEGCEGRPLDERADIWAFGVMLFEMLTGQHPFQAETTTGILAAILTQPLPDLARYRTDIPPALAGLIERMLARDYEQRMHSVRLVGTELESIMADRPVTPAAPLAGSFGPPPPCPYLGLFAFQEADAPFFFGREAFTRQLVAAVRERALTAVIGSSGSGKSSVVFAGLVAHLRMEKGWLIELFRPGSDPFQGLAAALLPWLEPNLSETGQLVEARKLAESLQQGALPLADLIDRILQKLAGATRFLLVADQFEELYTLCPEPDTRHTFLDLLFEIIDLQQYLPRPSFSFVFTLRADFLEQALAHRAFADALQDHDFKLGPMNREELGRAIERPAEKQQVAFETGLVERILDDVGEEPGNLPLLEFALTALWAQQQGRKLSHAGYEAIARVEGALTRHADEVYAGLTPAGQAAARRIFTQLVRPGEGTEDTRRLALRAELSDEDWRLARRLADARLVVTGRDALGRETVEVVHEALIRSWGQLRDWMAADRAFRIWQERLRVALRQWDATGQDEGALLRGAPLVEAETWLSEREIDLSRAEQGFIQASLALRERRAQERETQRQRELAAARKLAETEAQAAAGLRKRAIWLAGVGLVAVVLAVVAGLFGIQSSRNAAEARAEQSRADAERDVAVSRRLAIEAADQLERANFDPALLLAIEATHAAQTLEAWTTLRQALIHPRPRLLLTFLGHTASLNEWGLAHWNADESRILTASYDNTARVWDVETGKELLLLSGHEDTVMHASWSSDESRILTASHDGTARIWDAASGDELLKITTLEDALNWAMWSPDDSRILTVGDADKASVWDAQTGQELLTLSGHSGFIQLGRWNRDGSRIITNSADGTARVWDAESGEELLILAGHEDGVIRALWNADESLILTASIDGTAKLWDATTGETFLTFAGHTDYLWNVTWNRDESRILTSGSDGTARVWDTTSGEELLTLSGHSDTIAEATWNPDESLIVTASDDGTARVWDAKKGQELATFGHPGPVGSAAWSADGRRILTAGADVSARIWAWADQQESQFELPALLGSPLDYYQAMWNRDERLILTAGQEPTGYVRVWEAATGGVRLTLSGHTDDVIQAIWNADESRILTASDDGTARVWEAATGQERLRLTGHSEEVRQAIWNANESRILTASEDGTARVWDAATGQELLALVGHTAWIGQAAWNADESRILTYSGDGTTKVWDAETGGLLLTLSGYNDEVWQSHWNADGTEILTGGKDGRVQVWDAQTGQVKLMLDQHLAGITTARWNADESRILTASDDGTARVWEAKTGVELLTLSGHTDGVNHAIWNADESRILTTGDDDTVRLWDAATGEELVIIHDSSPERAVWSVDGSRILVVGNRGARQYYTRLEDVIAVACERLPRNLGQSEWQQFMGEQPYRATCPDLPVPEQE